MIKIRHLLFSLGYKFFVLVLCFSIIGVHYLAGRVLFKRNATTREIESALSSGNVDAKNEQGVTGLMFAADQGMLDRAQAFLNSGADMNMHSDKEHMTPLHFAIYNADNEQSFEIAKMLLDEHADIRARATLPLRKIQNVQPWHCLINVDSDDTYMNLGKFMVHAGADINAQTNGDGGYTLLHLAVENNDEGRVRYTLQQFGSLLLARKMRVKTPQGIKLMNPQEYAQFLRFEDVMTVFEEEKVDIVGYSDQLIDEKNVIFERDPNGFDALMVAILRDDEKQVKRLFRLGAKTDSEADDEYRKSPLQLAVLHRKPNMVRLLLDQNADIAYVNKKGNTVLHLIPRVYDDTKQKEILDVLLANESRKNAVLQILNTQNDRGDTPLHVGVVTQNVAFVQRMLQEFWQEIDFEIKNNRRATPRELAQRWKRTELVELLTTARNKKATQSIAHLKTSVFKAHSIAAINLGSNWANGVSKIYSIN